MKYFLYIKTHKPTGMKYLGQTKRDSFTYPGSGQEWLKHLKEHGKDVYTEILGEFDSIQELEKMGRYYSLLWNIVESSEWANLMIETGHGKGWTKGKKRSETTKEKMKKSWENRTHSLDHLVGNFVGRKHTEESKQKMSLARLGKKLPKRTKAWPPQSEETKKKRSEAMKKPWSPARWASYKRKYAINIEKEPLDEIA
jgi:hypothetical protein